MAKQAKQDEMSFGEKHVEKGVMVLCLGLLLFSIWHWGLSSPRRVPLIKPGSADLVIEVPPEQVDATLKKAAERVKVRHENEKPVGDPPVGPELALQELRKTPFTGAQTIALGQPRRPQWPYDPKDDTPPIPLMEATVATLQKAIPPLDAPAIAANWALVDVGANPYDGPVDRGALSFSLAKLTEIWEGLKEAPKPPVPGKAVPAKIELGKTVPGKTAPGKAEPAKPSRLLKYINFEQYPIRIVGVEIEVQEADDVNADWAAIEPRPLQDTRLPIPVAVEGKEVPPLKRLPLLPATCAIEDRKPVFVAINTIIQHMEDLIQPEFYPILDPSGQNWDSWYRHLPREPVEAAGGAVTETLRQLEAADAARATGSGRRGAPPTGGRRGAPPTVGRRGPTPTPTRRGPPPTRGGIDPARPGGGYDPARPGGGYDPARPGGSRRPPARPRDGYGRRPRTTVDPARPGEGEGEGEGEGLAVVDTAIVPPAFDAQLQAGNFLVWFHNMNVTPGKAYRYRVRLKLLNPLFNNEDMLKPELVAEASITTIPTPWSAWSKPVRTVRQMDFFLVDAKRNNLRDTTGKAKVTVFTRRLGQLVVNEFTLVDGEPIGGEAITMLKNPPPSIFDPPAEAAAGAVAPPIASEQEVDFATGAVVVDINLTKRMYKAGRDIKTAEMLFVDARKRLSSRLLMKNQSPESPERKRYEELLAEARIAAAAARGEEEREDSGGR